MRPQIMTGDGKLRLDPARRRLKANLILINLPPKGSPQHGLIDNRLRSQMIEKRAAGAHRHPRRHLPAGHARKALFLLIREPPFVSEPPHRPRLPAEEGRKPQQRIGRAV